MPSSIAKKWFEKPPSLTTTVPSGYSSPTANVATLFRSSSGIDSNRGILFSWLTSTCALPWVGLRRETNRNRACGQPSTPVLSCGAPTGFDSGEPRWRRYTVRTANEPTARNSDCQFCSVPSQKVELPI